MMRWLAVAVLMVVAFTFIPAVPVPERVWVGFDPTCKEKKAVCLATGQYITRRKSGLRMAVEGRLEWRGVLPDNYWRWLDGPGVALGPATQRATPRPGRSTKTSAFSVAYVVHVGLS
jgi:hypothetical protein